VSEELNRAVIGKKWKGLPPEHFPTRKVYLPVADSANKFPPIQPGTLRVREVRLVPAYQKSHSAE